MGTRKLARDNFRLPGSLRREGTLGEPRTRTFYRVATSFPPADQDYTTASERRHGAPPPSYVPLDHHRSWYEGYSAFDTQEAAVRLARRMQGKLGKLVVRYDIPEGAGITWEPVPGDEESGHFDLYGDKNVLKRYLATDFRLEVEIAEMTKAGEGR